MTTERLASPLCKRAHALLRRLYDLAGHVAIVIDAEPGPSPVFYRAWRHPRKLTRRATELESTVPQLPEHSEPTAVTGWRPWRSKAFWRMITGVALLRLAVSLAFRTQHPIVIGALKRFNHRWLNPLMLHLAGSRHWYAGRLEHQGRTTGRSYATPLWVDPVSGGFAMPLPYGRNVDWARNLMAAGGGVLQDHGVRSWVHNPRIVPAVDILPGLPIVTRRIVATYGVRDFMRVDALPTASVGDDS